MVFTHGQVRKYTYALLAIGLVHHADHVLRYDHSGWPFISEVTPFTFSLIVYPAILSFYFFRQKTYKVVVATIIAIGLIAAHTLLETPVDQYNMWAHNHSSSTYSAGDHNLLNIQSPVLGVVSTSVSMLLNLGVLALPFVCAKEEDKSTSK